MLTSRIVVIVGLIGLVTLMIAPFAVHSTAQAQTPVPGKNGQPGATPSTPEATPVCRNTQSAGCKCGTDIDLGPVSCGGETCYQELIRYGTILNCTGSATGLSKCCSGWCTKTVIKQACEEGVCTPQDDPTVTKVIPNSFACGDPCPSDPEQVVP